MMESSIRTREDLERWQCQRLNRLLPAILESNRFYQDKFKGLSVPLRSLDEWKLFPTTSKPELSEKANFQGLAPHLSFPMIRYTRFHRTSGTTGKPLIILDTPDDWKDWIEAWQFVLDAAEIYAADVVFMAFSFGPFIGFWTAQDACLARGCRVVPGGGLSTLARIDLLRDSGASVLFSTPTYAMHLAETANGNGIDPRQLGIRKLIVAGEPGGSVSIIRKRLEDAFEARVTDHAGATEIGAWGFGTPDGCSLEIIESHFIAEFETIESTTLSPQKMAFHSDAQFKGPLCELILTNLNRSGAPALRFRTGDIVCPAIVEIGQDGAGFASTILQGGILGRADQMMTVRGVNVFPSAIEAIVRSFAEIGEYRMIATKVGTRDELTLQIEDSLHSPKRLADKLDSSLGLRIEVKEVPFGTLESFADKAKRFIDRR